MVKNVQTNMGALPKRIAIVYDWAVKWGGAEQILLALHQLFPSAQLYTSVYNSNQAAWAKIFPAIISSFLQKVPLSTTHHEFFPALTPLAFESLQLNNYDLVISVTSSDAKGIITSPATLHVCYCLTPTRYLWSHHTQYVSQLSPLMKWLSLPIFRYLKTWDIVASSRPDEFLSISTTVQNRIKVFYNKDSNVIYPPVDVDKFTNQSQEYYLWVGRFVSYKDPLLVATTFNNLGLPLVMVGSGSELSKVKRIAKKNIILRGHVNDQNLVEIYKHAKALIMFHEEDFGIVSIEAQSAGIPVIALNQGGGSETVLDGETGVLCTDLAAGIKRFETMTFNKRTIIANAQKFSKERFVKEFGKVVTKLWTQHQNTHTF